jgi:hypothetical protein
MTTATPTRTFRLNRNEIRCMILRVKPNGCYEQLFGPAYKELRKNIIEAITGKRTPPSKAGWTHMQTALEAYAMENGADFTPETNRYDRRVATERWILEGDIDDPAYAAMTYEESCQPVRHKTGLRVSLYLEDNTEDVYCTRNVALVTAEFHADSGGKHRWEAEILLNFDNQFTQAKGAPKSIKDTNGDVWSLVEAEDGAAFTYALPSP